jgi:hypothetical protein
MVKNESQLCMQRCLQNLQNNCIYFDANFSLESFLPAGHIDAQSSEQFVCGLSSVEILYWLNQALCTQEYKAH